MGYKEFMKLVKRNKDYEQIKRMMSLFSVTAILGPRQCGKTTLARQISYDHYFDLENPRDIARLDQPQLALEGLDGTLVIDEIQRKPELFPLMRFLVDTHPTQKYLILGSASRDLIKQSSESLAGRIAYYHLGGFRLTDIGAERMKALWLRGGLPLSFLARTDSESNLWRQQYITTFLERDLPQLGIHIPARTLRRFWAMLGHYHGQAINYSELARTFGISDMTVRRYSEILEGAFMIRILRPWFTNTKKRLVKHPKIFFRDPGIFHSLMSIETMEQLQGHNKLGASWEGFALECVARTLTVEDASIYFWGTHAGAELDLFWQQGGRNWGAEFKYLDAPRLTKSMKVAMEELGLAHLWIVYPGSQPYRVAENATVLPLRDLGDSWTYPS